LDIVHDLQAVINSGRSRAGVVLSGIIVAVVLPFGKGGVARACSVAGEKVGERRKFDTSICGGGGGEGKVREKQGDERDNDFEMHVGLLKSLLTGVLLCREDE
jgi:hypothetical protein